MFFCKYTSLRVKLMLAALLMIMPTYAQQAVEEDAISSYAIEEITVTANRHKFSVEAAMPAQMLSGRELEKLNSFSVADAIRYFSGVQLKDYGGVGGLKTINVRSLGSAHTAVFYTV